MNPLFVPIILSLLATIISTCAISTSAAPPAPKFTVVNGPTPIVVKERGGEFTVLQFTGKVEGLGSNVADAQKTKVKKTCGEKTEDVPSSCIYMSSAAGEGFSITLKNGHGCGFEGCSTIQVEYYSSTGLLGAVTMTAPTHPRTAYIEFESDHLPAGAHIAAIYVLDSFGNVDSTYTGSVLATIRSYNGALVLFDNGLPQIEVAVSHGHGAVRTHLGHALPGDHILLNASADNCNTAVGSVLIE